VVSRRIDFFANLLAELASLLGRGGAELFSFLRESCTRLLPARRRKEQSSDATYKRPGSQKS
jgi:hypothetical protein